MKDLDNSIFVGLGVGSTVIGPVGWIIFGPIYGNSDIWFLIGAVLGVAMHLRIYFQRKKEELNQKKNEKNE